MKIKTVKRNSIESLKLYRNKGKPEQVKVFDIKDRKPNLYTIRNLELALEDAKTGELRSCLIVNGWDNDSVNHSWVVDERSSPRPILSELLMILLDYANKTGIDEGDSALARALNGDG